MKIEEALSDLRNLYGDGSTEYVMHPLKVGTVKLAIEALEKQIPKKPVLMWVDKRKTVAEPFCGRCKIMYVTRAQEYCEDCGQKIDWSDDE